MGIPFVQARAGGGEEFIDVGGGGSNNSGGGSFYYYGSGNPIFFIIAAVIIIVIIRAVRKKFTQHAGAGLQQALAGRSVISGAAILPDISTGLAAIKQKDADFDEQSFKDKANTAFFKVQYAWQKKDMEVARAFVSDSIMERYTVQLQDLKDKHWTNHMDNVAVGSTEIAKVNQDEKFDKITVRISASAADYTMDDATGKVVKGSQTPNHFTEYWTFIRSKSAHTDKEKSLKNEKCPSCGAALQVSATGKCNYCSSVVTSGEYDWVLSEITQQGDFERMNLGSPGQGGAIGANVEKTLTNAVAGAVIAGLLGGFRRRR